MERVVPRGVDSRGLSTGIGIVVLIGLIVVLGIAVGAGLFDIGTDFTDPAETNASSQRSPFNQTAAPVDSEEPAAFAVAELRANESVVEGDRIVASATVTNTGDFEGTRTVSLLVNGTDVANTTVSGLGGGASAIVDLGYTTSEADLGARNVTVATADDANTTTTEVVEPAFFAVESLSVPEIEEGEDIVATATITNTGDAQASQVIELLVDNDRENETSPLAVEGGQRTTVVLGHPTDQSDDGPHNIVVASEDDRAVTTIVVQDDGDEIESDDDDTAGGNETEDDDSDDTDEDDQPPAPCQDDTPPATPGAVLDALDGNGTSTAPYQLTSVCELQAMAADRDGAYELAANVSATAATQWNEGAGFTPVGTAEQPFTGVFDGNGHVIDGLALDRTDTETIGLFGVAANASLTDVSLTNIAVEGRHYVGALAGKSQQTTVSDVSVSGDVTGTARQGAVGGLVGKHTVAGPPANATIEDVQVAGTVTGERDVGGVAGYNDGLLRDAHSTAAITSERGGGLVGWNRGGIVTQSAATGNVTGAGGLVGRVGHMGNEEPLPIAGAVTQSYATGTVTGDGDVGGLVGSLLGGSQLTNSYSTADVTSSDRAGGLVGTATQSSYVQHAFATGEVDGETAVGGLVGFLQWSNLADAYWNVQTTGQTEDVGGIVGTDEHHWLTRNTQENGLTTAAMTGVGAVANMSLDETAIPPCGHCTVVYEDNADAESLWIGTDGYPRLHWQNGSIQPDPGEPVTVGSCDRPIVNEPNLELRLSFDDDALSGGTVAVGGEQRAVRTTGTVNAVDGRFGEAAEVLYHENQTNSGVLVEDVPEYDEYTLVFLVRSQGHPNQSEFPATDAYFNTPLIGWEDGHFVGAWGGVESDRIPLSGETVFDEGFAKVVTTDNIGGYEWHHIAVTYDPEAGATGYRHHLNSSFVEPQSDSFSFPSTSQAGSSDFFLGNSQFNGEFDEVHLYDEAMTETQIQAHREQFLFGCEQP
jgi:hypothetical protein